MTTGNSDPATASERPSSVDDSEPEIQAPPAEHLADLLKERVYITFSSLAVVLALTSHADRTTPAQAMTTLLIAVSGTLLAVLVADFIAHLVVHQTIPDASEFRHMLSVGISGLIVVAVPLILIALAWAGVWSLGGALSASAAVLVLSLVAVGYLAVRRVRLPLWQRFVVLAAEALLGLVVVGLELLAHR